MLDFTEIETIWAILFGVIFGNLFPIPPHIWQKSRAPLGALGVVLLALAHFKVL